MTTTSIQTSIPSPGTDPTTRGRRLRAVATVAALGLGLLVGCGEAVNGTGPAVGAVTPARTPVSADAAERRSVSITERPVAAERRSVPVAQSPVSADAAERRSAADQTGSAVTADAAERRAAELRAQLREIRDSRFNR